MKNIFKVPEQDRSTWGPEGGVLMELGRLSEHYSGHNNYVD